MGWLVGQKTCCISLQSSQNFLQRDQMFLYSMAYMYLLLLFSVKITKFPNIELPDSVYFSHRIREGEPGLPIPPCIMAPSAMEQKLGRVGFLPNSARKLTE